jgi:hypothetical protein
VLELADQGLGGVTPDLFQISTGESFSCGPRGAEARLEVGKKTRVVGGAKNESHGEGESAVGTGNQRRLIVEIFDEDAVNKICILWRVAVGKAVAKISSEKLLTLRSFGSFI